MVAEERQMQICDLLSARNAVQIGELGAQFQVSAETIRRDLLALEQKGLLRRTHGGAVSLSRMAHAKNYAQRQEEFQPQKQELAQTALSMLQDGDTITLDSGTTATQLARLLPGRFRELTVITYAMDVAQELKNAPGIHLILTGGYYLAEENACWGDFSLSVLQRLHADKAFLCPSAVSLSGGITDYSYQLLPLQKAYLGMADRVFILADSSKFEKTARLQISALSPEHTLITDSALSLDICALYRKKSLSILRGKTQK